MWRCKRWKITFKIKLLDSRLTFNDQKLAFLITIVFPKGNSVGSAIYITQEHWFLKILGCCLLRGNILYCYISFQNQTCLLSWTSSLFRLQLKMQMFRDKMGTCVWWKWNHICIGMSCWLSNLHQEWKNSCKKSLMCVHVMSLHHITSQLYGSSGTNPEADHADSSFDSYSLPLFFYMKIGNIMVASGLELLKELG